LGRVVKGAKLRSERYALSVPEPSLPPPAQIEESDGYALTDGFAYDADGGLIPDYPLAPPPPPAIDVEQLRADAEALLERASREAEALLRDAHARARTLIEEASTRAHSLEQDARTKGHDEGFGQGREAADRDMNDMLVTMRGLLEMARVERHKLIEQAEPELVRLALGIAERILHQQVALDRGVAVEMAKTAIARLIERDTVTVRVNPADLERMREHRDELIAIGDIRNLRVVEDQRVDRGGVVVDTGAGTIDARISTQLEEARKILHIEEELVVEPAPGDSLPKSELTAARAS
jgi:flagellar assembly protein FliH